MRTTVAGDILRMSEEIDASSRGVPPEHAQAMIHWGGGFVSSTNNVGCALGRGHDSSAGTMFPVAALIFAIGWRRSRRR